MDPKKSNLYTRTGDNGKSSLYNGKREPKYSIYFNFLGDFDELNSNLGLVKAYHQEQLDTEPVKVYNGPGAGPVFYKTAKSVDTGKYYEWYALCEIINKIQCNIMDISSFVATPPPHEMDTGTTKFEPGQLELWVSRVGFDSEQITVIEKLIDRLDSLLPRLTNFVLPPGNKLVSQIHVCRSIVRRCERKYIELCETVNYNYISSNELVRSQTSTVGIYLNRLSDLLFVMSRFVTHTLELDEDIYSRNNRFLQKSNIP